MSKEKTLVTPAIRILRKEKVSFQPHLYAYEEKGRTEVSAHRRASCTGVGIVKVRSGLSFGKSMDI
jgi:hypothetical protein